MSMEKGLNGPPRELTDREKETKARMDAINNQAAIDHAAQMLFNLAADVDVTGARGIGLSLNQRRVHGDPTSVETALDYMVSGSEPPYEIIRTDRPAKPAQGGKPAAYARSEYRLFKRQSRDIDGPARLVDLNNHIVIPPPKPYGPLGPPEPRLEGRSVYHAYGDPTGRRNSVDPKTGEQGPELLGPHEVISAAQVILGAMQNHLVQHDSARQARGPQLPPQQAKQDFLGKM